MKVEQKIMFYKELIQNKGRCYPETRKKYNIDKRNDHDVWCRGCPIKQKIRRSICTESKVLKYIPILLKELPQNKLDNVFEVFL